MLENTKTIIDKLAKQKQVLEKMGYKVAYIALYGSQNYGLDIDLPDYKSDIDMKAIVVPTLDNLITNAKPVSIVVDTEDGGQCDVKDIRSFFETLLKANPAYVETLFTDYYIIDDDFIVEMETVLSMREELVHALRAQFIRAMYGMMLEKEKALTHPYPSIIHKIEKWGYDGKQAHHVLRLQLLMYEYFWHGKLLQDCFYPDKCLDTLLDLKLNKYSLEEVKVIVSQIMVDTKHFKDQVLTNIDEQRIDYSIKDKFIALSQSIIKEKIINDILDIYQ